MVARRSPGALLPVLLLALMAIAFAVFVSDDSKDAGADGLRVAREESEGTDGLEVATYSLPVADATKESSEPIEFAGAARTETARAAVPTSKGEQLIVEVRDTYGNPVPDLPLVVADDQPTGTLKSLRDAGAHVEVTDQNGRATFPGDKHRFADYGMTLYHLVAFETLPSVRLTEAVLAPEVLESVQPPYGSIVIRATGMNGESAPSLRHADVQRITEAEKMDPSLAKRRRSYKVPRSDEAYELQFVELGGRWQAGATGAFNGMETTIEGDGPMRSGEQATFEIRMGSNRPVVKVRLLGPDRAPLSVVAVRVESSGGFLGTQSYMAGTDEDGFLWIEVEGELIQYRPPTLTLTVDQGAEDPTIAASLGPLKTLNVGENDIGDLVLASERVLISGTAFDELGPPIPGATIWFGQSVEGKEMSVQRSFRTDGAAEAVTDEEGNFQFEGIEFPQAAKVWAFIDTDSGRKQTEILEVDTVGTHVKLHLRRAFVPTAEVLLPKLANMQGVLGRLSLSATSADGSGELLLSQRTHVSGDDKLIYSFQGVFGGRFNIRCTFTESAAEETVLMETLDVPVVGDGPLVTYDLRKSLYVHRLLLVDPHAEVNVAIGGTYRVLVKVPMWSTEDGGEPTLAGEMEDWKSSKFLGTSIEIVSLNPSVDVRVLPNNFREEHIEGLSGERVIHLRPPLRVRLVLMTTGTLPADPYTFDPVLYLDGDRIGKPVGSRWFTHDDRECVFVLPTPGKVTVKWHFEKRLEHGAVGGEVLSSQQQTIDVLDTPEEQRIELHLDAKALTGLSTNPPF